MNLKPTDYDFGVPENYSFASNITCADEKTRQIFVLGYGHMLNYNHEEAIACFMKCTELDPNCAMAWWGIAYCVYHLTIIGPQGSVPDMMLSNRVFLLWDIAQNWNRI